MHRAISFAHILFVVLALAAAQPFNPLDKIKKAADGVVHSGMNYVNDGVQRVARYSDSHSTNAAPQPSANAAPFAARPPLRRESMMQNPINNQPGQPQNSLAYQTPSYQQQQTAQQESLPSQSSGFMGSSNYMSHSSQLPGQSNSIPNYQPQDYFHDHPGNAYNQPHIPLYQQ